MKIRSVVYLFLIVLLASFVSSYQLQCYNRNEVMPGGLTCNFDCCKLCTTDEGYQSLPQNCYDSSCECSGESSNPIQPTYLTIHSPVDGTVYYADRVLLNVSASSDVSSISYKIDSEAFTTFCTNCQKEAALIPASGMADGDHVLTVRKQDALGVSDEEVNFKVDTTAPVITETLPANGTYVNNDTFSVTYTESNVNAIEAYYKSGNETEYNTASFTGCTSGDSQTCSKVIDLSAYEVNTSLGYYFKLSDGIRTPLAPL